MLIALPSHVAPARARAKTVTLSVGGRVLALGCCFALSALVLVFLYYIGLFTSNFRTVSEDRLYRSAQMKPGALQDTIDRHGIRSVVNLRGRSRSGAWYFNEIATCKSAGIDHQSIELDNETLPHPDELRALLTRLEQGPFPMLIHCRRGADRTGLAAVIYLVVFESHALEDARRSQLTWHQGHINLAPDANDRFLALYASTAAGKPLRDWILEVYPELHRRMHSN